jgi:N-acyl-D-aspartate/D-glutamate deacylase
MARGAKAIRADVAISGDTIAAVGFLGDAAAKNEIDAKGPAVAPGFINMLSWANEALIQDGRSQSDIRQGVTLEVMGEGISMGPPADRLPQSSVAAAVGQVTGQSTGLARQIAGEDSHGPDRGG